MTYRFTANIAYGWHEPGPDVYSLGAGVAESDGGGFALEFQAFFDEPDAQNIRNGTDSYCVVTPDQCTAYGCVRTVELEGDILRITFDPDCLEALFLDDPVVEAVLQAPAADVARMREALTRILAYGRPDALPIVVGV
ncbi:Imm10 family immunity protein [Streptomyces sp. NPDC032940]|uniref:Imm10 family immunity protein n=1 Tax=Streptomyces sp. NPDC032940 TaxID=3155366 RepID=UPI0033F6F4DE